MGINSLRGKSRQPSFAVQFYSPGSGLFGLLMGQHRVAGVGGGKLPFTALVACWVLLAVPSDIDSTLQVVSLAMLRICSVTVRSKLKCDRELNGERGCYMCIPS